MNHFKQNLKNNIKGLILTAILIIAVVAGLFVKNEYLQLLLVTFLFSCIFTMAMNLIMGFAGQFAISNPSFMALGAYTSAVLVTNFGWSFWPSVVFMIPVAIIISSIVGYITLRFTSGIYLNIVTIAIVGLTLLIIKHPFLAPYTGGVNGLTTNYLVALGPIHLVSTKSWYAFMIIVTIITFVFIYRLVNARTGRAWIALRENEQLAISLGIKPTYYKTLAYVISSLLAAFGGALSAPFFKFISDGSFNIEVAIIQCVTLAVGGFGTLSGPIIGSLVFTIIPELLRPIAELRMAVFGLILILVMLFMPGGISSFISIALSNLSRKSPVHTPLKMSEQEAKSTLAYNDIRGLAPQESRSADERIGDVILEVKSLGKTYGGLRALSDFDCQLRKGEIVGLIGPNGAGKSTLLKVLAGFEKPTQGRVTFDGEDITGRQAERLSAKGIVRTFQEVVVFPELTVMQHMMVARHLEGKVGLFFDLFGGPRVRRINESNMKAVKYLLHLCGLSEHIDTIGKNLSYGEMKKLSIAMALATAPKILLLDEATAGLSAEETESIANVIKSINALGVTIVVVEHNVPFISSLANKVIVLDLGKKIAEDAPKIVLNDKRVIAAYIGG